MPEEEEGIGSPASRELKGPQSVIMDIAWEGGEAGPVGRMQGPPGSSSPWGSVPDSLLSPMWARCCGDSTEGGSFLNPFHRCGVSGSVSGASWLVRQRQDLEPVLPVRELPSGSCRAWHSGRGVSQGG